jgi:uncharacterized membrane protein
MQKIWWILKQAGRQLWLRTVMFCVLALITALLGYFLKPYIPEDIPRRVGAESVEGILLIIANSMLVVTTFSLSTMVSAYTAATNNVTPRATKLLLEDPTSQNALSVFIGAFLFSLASIIAISMEIYGSTGLLILYVVTILVICLIIVVLLRWISYLSGLGRVSNTIRMVESATCEALENRIEQPYLGGTPLHDKNLNGKFFPVACHKIGFIQFIDMPSLSKHAREYGTELYIHKIPGSFSNGVEPLLFSSLHLDTKAQEAICNNFVIADERSFDQDPRYGFIVMSEIACRALSPAINDPGTAIDVITTAYKLLMPWVNKKRRDPEPLYTDIHVIPLETENLLGDVFPGIARDGASNLQVGIIIQKMLRLLARQADEISSKEIQKTARYAFDYSKKFLALDPEIETIKSYMLDA